MPVQCASKRCHVTQWRIRQRQKIESASVCVLHPDIVFGQYEASPHIPIRVPWTRRFANICCTTTCRSFLLVPIGPRHLTTGIILFNQYNRVLLGDPGIRLNTN